MHSININVRSMKITIFSNLFKINENIFIVEIYQNLQNQKFLYIRMIQEKESQNDYFLQENPFYYAQNNDFSLIFEGQNHQKLQTKIKKELTIPLQKLKKDNYIVYLKNTQNKKKILNIDIS